MPSRGMTKLAEKVPPSPTQKPDSFVTVAISDFRPRGHQRLPFGRGDIDAPAVDHDVLRRAGKSERKRKDDRPGEPAPGLAEGDADQRRHDRTLRNDDPTSPAPEQTARQRRVIAIEGGGPPI